jgi:signal transduction histidine kinase
VTIDPLAGGGEMGALMRSVDWEKTAVGAVSAWPQSLRTALSILLETGFPMYIAWGSDFTQFYNDGYRPILGSTKHPAAMGRSTRETFAEIWSIIGPMFQGVMEGTATTVVDFLLPLDRHGFVEDCYFIFSYSPIREEGGSVGGVLVTVTETTERILGARRLKTLQALSARTQGTTTAERACEGAAAVLGENPDDVPFALLYLLAPDGERAVLAGAAGIAPGTAASPEEIDLAATDSPLPIAAVAAVATSGVPQLLGELPGGAVPKPEQPEPAAASAPSAASAPWRGLVLPIAQPGEGRPTGVLVAALSPRLVFDDKYRSFLDLVAGQIATAIATARSLAAAEARAEALAEIDRAKTAFFSNVSHEFRTPLTLMLGPTEEALAQGDRLPAEDLARWQLVHRNGLRLLKLVNTLLDVSRIEAGRVQAIFEPVDLSTYTAELASVFRSAVEKASMRLLLDLPPLGEPVYVDRDMWEKIVLNLVSNAFKYTLNGEIEVSLREADGAAVLAVRDTGTGIPETELPKLFDRFYRVEGARGRTHEGTGIGLALVRDLVHLHGGSVTVESTEGVGSTFTVAIPLGREHLPAERLGGVRTLASTALGANPFVEEALRSLGSTEDPNPQEHAERVEGAERLGPTTARILLADDNADMGDYVRRLLAERWEVELVTDGEAALAAARERPPDLVLADVMMPRLDGFGLLRELRADPRTATIPILLLSARAGEEARVSGLERGADDYLIKPFSARELLARVGAHLEMARLRKAAEAELARLLAVATEARQQAEAANRLKDEFLATISHELRTPLNAILGWVQLLQVRGYDAPGTERALATIERNARAQNQLIEDLLDVSRIITGKLRLDVRQVDLLSVVEAAVEVVQPTAETKGVRLQAILDPLAGPVSGDPARLQQIVWNVLANAIKFTPKGGRVQVRLERVDSSVQVVVADTGIGIDPAFKPYVFERFRQADASSSRAYGGLGLGLAIVRHLVDLHGGTVRAESAGVGQGATFILSFPLTIAHAAAPAGAALGGPPHPLHPAAGAALPFTPSPVLAGIRVLVVDDELDARTLITAILEQCAASVTTASSVAEALAVLDGEPIDVVLSDIEMPGEDGYSFIRKLRSREGQGFLPAAALTAYARAEDRHRAIVAGYQIHIPKPVEPAEVVAVVASLAQRPR